MTDTQPAAQLVFEGLTVAEQRVQITGTVTLPADQLDTLSLGDVFDLSVRVIVKGIAGKQQRDEWGDDHAAVTYTLAVHDKS